MSNPTIKLREIYALGRELGSGSFSVVRIATKKTTGEKFAIKCIRRKELEAEDIEALRIEVDILQNMNHPNIMRLYEVYTEEDYIYLVTELAPGGELFDRIVEKSYYSEKEARDLVIILLKAIQHCHDADIVHRDLKPENLLLASKESDADIKIADFGFAKKANSNGLETTCGTPNYVAPEILSNQPYGKEVDIWSIGVIVYILLCGYPPFNEDSQALLFRQIKRGNYEFDSPYWDEVSQDAKDFVSCMLKVNPMERWTAAQLLKHKWLETEDVKTEPLVSALDQMRKFNAKRKLKAAISTVKTTISLTRSLSLSGASKSQEQDSGNVAEAS